MGKIKLSSLILIALFATQTALWADDEEGDDLRDLVHYDSIVALVNGKSLTYQHLIQRSRLERKFRALERAGDQRSMAAKQQLLARKLGELVQELVILNEAKRLGVDPTDEDRKEVSLIIKERAEKKGGLEELKLWLQSKKIDYSIYEHELMTDIIIGRVYRQTVSRDIFIKPEAVRQYYKEHSKDYVRPALTRIRRIHLSKRESALTPAGKKWVDAKKIEWDAKACKMLGMAIRQRLKSGEEPAQLARDYTMLDFERSKSGLHEYETPESQYAPVKGLRGLSGITDKMKEGDITELLESRRRRELRGYDVIVLEVKRPRKQEAFKQVQRTIQRLVRQDEWQLQLKHWLQKLRKKATVQIFQDIGPSKSGASGEKS